MLTTPTLKLKLVRPTRSSGSAIRSMSGMSIPPLVLLEVLSLAKPKSTNSNVLAELLMGPQDLKVRDTKRPTQCLVDTVLVLTAVISGVETSRRRSTTRLSIPPPPAELSTTHYHRVDKLEILPRPVRMEGTEVGDTPRCRARMVLLGTPPSPLVLILILIIISSLRSARMHPLVRVVKKEERFLWRPVWYLRSRGLFWAFRNRLLSLGPLTNLSLVMFVRSLSSNFSLSLGLVPRSVFLRVEMVVETPPFRQE